MDLSTPQGRRDYLIQIRKRNINEFEGILNGTNRQYQKYMHDERFLNDVKRNLEIEKDLLNDLLEMEF